MTRVEFATAMIAIRRELGGSVTSAGRTDAHAISVGGFAGDPHTWDLGEDLIYDHRPELEIVGRLATRYGLKVLREVAKPHDHFQPADFPAGPVTVYHGMTREVFV